MKKFLVILTFVLAMILQTTVVSFLSFLNVIPNLVLVLVLLLVILKNFKKAWWIILLIGFFMDLFSGLPFGIISLSLVISSYFIDWLNETILSAVKFSIIIALISIGVLSYNLILIILSKFFILSGIDSMIFVYFNGSFIDLISNLIIKIVYNSFVAVLIFYVAKKIFYQTANA